MESQLDKEINVTFRRVEIKDCRKIWLWRNEKVVREISFSSDTIPYSHHQRWFKKRLKEDDCLFLMILWKNQEVGILRYDLEGPSAEVHITIAPEMRNKGIGTLSLQMGSVFLFKKKNVDFILAHIKDNNLSSIRTFEKAGFLIIQKMKFKGANTIEMGCYKNNEAFKIFFPKTIGAIIQSRMGSKRLPGKSLMDVDGKPLLKHIIENQKTSKYLSRIILATTERDEDKPLLELAEKLGICGFAGSENDVLARYVDATKAFGLDIVVRVTGDNILTDVNGMDRTIALYLKEEPDLATNGGEKGYPLGTAVEVLSANLLQKINETVCSADEREHVTLHLYRQKEKYRILCLNAPLEYKDLDVRLTIDTLEDLSLIRQLCKKLKKSGEDFSLPLIAKHIKNNPDIKKINSHIKQKVML
tara:strand:+ start:2548 stop:3795 length:1248 start_codon:yes stop_codon:yes gene_type:complete